MTLRSVPILALLLASAPALAGDLENLLKLRQGLPIEVREPERGPLDGILVRVAEDHFCIQFGERETLQARCYPYSAIRSIAPTDPKNDHYVIETF